MSFKFLLWIIRERNVETGRAKGEQGRTVDERGNVRGVPATSKEPFLCFMLVLSGGVNHLLCCCPFRRGKRAANDGSYGGLKTKKHRSNPEIRISHSSFFRADRNNVIHSTCSSHPDSPCSRCSITRRNQSGRGYRKRGIGHRLQPLAFRNSQNLFTMNMLSRWRKCFSRWEFSWERFFLSLSFFLFLEG